VQFKTPNSDGSTVNASILIGKSAQVMSWFTHPTNRRTLNSDARVLIPRHVTSFLRSIGNRGIVISPVAIPLHYKTLNVESRPPGISCHLSPIDQRLRCDREIANSDFNSYENLASGKPDMPICDGSWLLLRPRVRPLATPPRSIGWWDFAILLCEPWSLILLRGDSSRAFLSTLRFSFDEA
jgi:hypothetical protein